MAQFSQNIRELKYYRLFRNTALLFILFNVFNINSSYGQYQYSFDLNNVKARHVPVMFRLKQLKGTVKDDIAHYKEKRIERKTSRKTRKHAYAIQTHEVKKRMRKSSKNAVHHNKGTEPLIVRIKKYLKWTT